jgi:DnaJ-class molecular chaperone
LCSGDDLTMEAQIAFMTSVFGGQEKVRVRRLEECKTCSGELCALCTDYV